MYGILTYIYITFTIIYHTNQPHLGKYTSPMDGMGERSVKNPFTPHFFSGWSSSWRKVHLGEVIFQKQPQHKMFQDDLSLAPLVVWKILVNFSSFPQVGMKIKDIWNHQPVLFFPLQIILEPKGPPLPGCHLPPTKKWPALLRPPVQGTLVVCHNPFNLI